MAAALVQLNTEILGLCEKQIHFKTNTKLDTYSLEYNISFGYHFKVTVSQKQILYSYTTVQVMND
jgi:hypothetical protein